MLMDPDRLRSLCVKNQWFTCGTNSQYEKMFEINETTKNINLLAVVIWACSADAAGSMEQIRNGLMAEMEAEL